MARKKQKVPNVYTPGNRTRLVRGGKDYFDTLIHMIDHAQKSFHLQTYIFDDKGETGKRVAAALTKAASRNVVVYLVLDGYASKDLSDDFIAQLKKAGIHFRFFEPIFRSRSFYFGRRMHHKIAVADASYAMVGGVNIADRYNDMPGIPAWLDFAIHVEGTTAKHLCMLCRSIWMGYTHQKATVACVQDTALTIPAAEDREVRIRRNDWVLRKNEISSTYIEMLLHAQSQVTILCSYFLPGKKIRRQMVRATKRGVKIRVIASGVSDVPIAKNAERWLYDWLLRHNIELYEYQKTVLHGKIATCDDTWMTGGSFNINNISAYASIELNLDVRDAGFAKEVRQTLEKIITEDCIHISAEKNAQKRTLFSQLGRWFSYQFVKVGIYVFTFYFKQKG